MASTLVDELCHLTAFLLIWRDQQPLVDDEKLGVGVLLQYLAVGILLTSQGNICKVVRQADECCRIVVTACLISKDASKISLSSAGRFRDEYIEIPLDVLAGPKFLDESAIQPPAASLVDLNFLTGLMM